MKRSDYIKSQNYKKKFYQLIFILFLFILFIYFIGFNLLINLSLFISNISKKNSQEVSTFDNNFFASISIDNFLSATNSAELLISGTVTNYEKINIYLNNEKIKTINVGKSGYFSEIISDLKLGNNSFYIEALTEDNKYRKKTRTYSVYYKKDKPRLEITDPKDNSVINNNEVLIKGTTDKEVFVQINNSPIVVDYQGSFQTTIRLQEGENTINIKATDIAGNIEEKEIKITYQKDW